MQILTTMITPYKADGGIDFDTAEKYVDWYYENGLDGIFAVCQSSEIFYLSVEERVELNRKVYKRAKALDNESELDDEGVTFDTTEQGQVFEAISSLSQKQKICIELYYIQGYSGDEISKILSMKPSAVRMNLKRAREALREILGKEYFDE